MQELLEMLLCLSASVAFPGLSFLEPLREAVRGVSLLRLALTFSCAGGVSAYPGSGGGHPVCDERPVWESSEPMI